MEWHLLFQTCGIPKLTISMENVRIHHENSWGSIIKIRRQVACRVDRNEGTYSIPPYMLLFLVGYPRQTLIYIDIRDKIRFPHSSSLVLTWTDVSLVTGWLILMFWGDHVGFVLGLRKSGSWEYHRRPQASTRPVTSACLVGLVQWVTY